MSNLEDKKPQIHIGGDAPRSPYVIDLRREIQTTPSPSFKKRGEDAVSDATIDPLLITNDDTVVQLSENDFTDRDDLIEPMLSDTMAEELAAL
ncbi:MAG: hypothetical protein Q7T18_02285, partial [Sedimentisphaerales bacterium]|nr:hypothetical protein [Sedimentisphaerales bacterium]